MTLKDEWQRELAAGVTRFETYTCWLESVVENDRSYIHTIRLNIPAEFTKQPQLDLCMQRMKEAIQTAREELDAAVRALRVMASRICGSDCQRRYMEIDPKDPQTATNPRPVMPDVDDVSLLLLSPVSKPRRSQRKRRSYDHPEDHHSSRKTDLSRFKLGLLILPIGMYRRCACRPRGAMRVRRGMVETMNGNMQFPEDDQEYWLEQGRKPEQARAAAIEAARRRVRTFPTLIR